MDVDERPRELVLGDDGPRREPLRAVEGDDRGTSGTYVAWLTARSAAARVAPPIRAAALSACMLSASGIGRRGTFTAAGYTVTH